jgi:hypothetical protein
VLERVLWEVKRVLDCLDGDVLVERTVAETLPAGARVGA